MIQVGEDTVQFPGKSALVYLEGWTQAQFDRLPEGEVTDDWTLVPGEELAREGFREYRSRIFDAQFTEQQRRVIAAYVEALPGLVELDWEDATLLGRSVRDHWGRFLPGRER